MNEDYVEDQLSQVVGDMSSIKRRQLHYWRGRELEESEHYEEAIREYIAYSEVLQESDRHIPYQWISIIYERLSMPEKAREYLIMYARGCNALKASEILKDVAKVYINLGEYNLGKKFLDEALQLNPQIAVKKLINQLSRS